MPSGPSVFQALSRWGSITRIEIGRDPIIGRDASGKGYATGELGPKWWKLRCDCGHEWKVFEHEFPGRIKLRNCQRPECPYNPPPPRVKRAEIGRPPLYEEQGICKTLYMPTDVVQGVVLVSNERQISFSRAAVELLRAGLMRIEPKHAKGELESMSPQSKKGR